MALETYTQVFDEEGALDKLEAFASLNGPAFYGLPANQETVTLKRGQPNPPVSVETSEGETVQVFVPDGGLAWEQV